MTCPPATTQTAVTPDSSERFKGGPTVLHLKSWRLWKTEFFRFLDAQNVKQDNRFLALLTFPPLMGLKWL